LGDQVVASMPYFSKHYDVYCLQPEESHASGQTIAEAMTQVYGGPGIDVTTLCSANPLGVSLDQAGFVQIASQQSVSQMLLFVHRVLNHMGGSVKAGSRSALASFAGLYAGDVGADAFARMAGYLGSRPEWTEFDPAALCVANREVHPSIVASSADWVCSQEGSECDDVPSLCEANPYRLGDFVFSRFAKGARARSGSSWNPLIDCSFGGAALFAPSEVYEQWVGARACAVGGTSTTSLTSLTYTITETTTSRTLASTTTETTSMEGSTSTHTDDAFLGSSICGVARPWLSVVFLWISVVQMWG